MLKSINITLFLQAMLVLAACHETPTTGGDHTAYFTPVDSGVQTGGVKVIPISTSKGTFNIWTKRTGNNPKIKVLLITGGPGATHEYAEAFDSFFPQEEIEYIYYDQLGCGHSDNPNDTALYDLDRSVDEVEQVRKALNLTNENFYIWGHSWGGVVAMEYALKYQQNLKALIISDMMASAKDYNDYADNVLAKQMDPKILDSIRAIEAKNDFDNPKYMELLMPNFYAKHICRLPEFPEPVARSLGKINELFYRTMQGPSEFGLSGKLTGWDVKGKLPQIKVPTLSIGAKYDTMDPEHMKWIAGQVQNGSYLYCPNGSHLCMYDDQAVYMKGLVKFILAVNNGEKKVALD